MSTAGGPAIGLSFSPYHDLNTPPYLVSRFQSTISMLFFLGNSLIAKVTQFVVWDDTSCLVIRSRESNTSTPSTPTMPQTLRQEADRSTPVLVRPSPTGPSTETPMLVPD